MLEIFEDGYKHRAHVVTEITPGVDAARDVPDQLAPEGQPGFGVAKGGGQRVGLPVDDLGAFLAGGGRALPSFYGFCPWI